MEASSDSYLTVAEEARAVFRDKASKFLAFVYPVTSENQVKEKLDELRKTYYDANHHCYAYRIGNSGQVWRLNDDGEPSGSAGKPIYGQLLSVGVSDVLAVVVRYFGGTKLGIPGLIHAYRTATREALDLSPVVERHVLATYTVRFGYHRMNEVMRILKEEGGKIICQDSGDECQLTFQIRMGQSDKIEEKFSRLRGPVVEKSD